MADQTQNPGVGPNFWAKAVAIATIVGAIVSVVSLYSLWQAQDAGAAQQQAIAEEVARLKAEREDIVRQSTYKAAMSGDLLILSASESASLPVKVTVRPIFDVPASELANAMGAAAQPYEGLRSVAHIDGKAVRIPGIKQDVCSVPENRDRCSTYDISEFKIDYSFGLSGALSTYVAPDLRL